MPTEFALCSAGPDSLPEGLLERCWPLLVARVDTMMGPSVRQQADPVDIVQDTIARILDCLIACAPRDETRFLRWTLGIAQNRIRDLARQRRPASGSRENLELRVDDEPWHEAVADEQSRRIAEALSTITTAQRHVLRLRYVEQLSFVEIGRRTARTDNAARLTHRRALSRMARRLGRAESWTLAG